MSDGQRRTSQGRRGTRLGGRHPAAQEVRAITRDGPMFLAVRLHLEVAVIAQHNNAVKHYLYTGETHRLQPFADIKIAGHILETDPDGLDYWARRGDLDFDTFYKDSAHGN